MANNVPMTERKYYQQPINNEWISTIPNAMYDDEGITDLSQTMTRKPIIDARMRNKPNSRKGSKARRTLRQSLQKAYNNQSLGHMQPQGQKLNSINFRKRSKNIFPNQIDFDTSGVRIDRSMLPKTNLTTFDSRNGSFTGNTPRLTSRNKGDSTFALKRQIKDLRYFSLPNLT
jgi:hypothetical protein